MEGSKDIEDDYFRVLQNSDKLEFQLVLSAIRVNVKLRYSSGTVAQSWSGLPPYSRLDNIGNTSHMSSIQSLRLQRFNW